MSIEQVAPRVWVIIVNWRGGRDTTECIQSLIENGGSHLGGIAVCDNDSPDDSMQYIRSYLHQRRIRYSEYSYKRETFDRIVAENDLGGAISIPEVVLINTGANLGFAGGNNVGIRYVSECGNFDYVLLLNNDASVGAGCLEGMVKRFTDGPQLGMVGCTILDAQVEDKVQAFGGASFQPWLARGAVIGANVSVDDILDVAAVEGRLDYIHGAAMMIRRECLECIGLMEERYFLYYEEIDWAIRARRAGFLLGYAESATVFHKGGASIGSSAEESTRSLLSEYYLFRSALLFTRKFYPYFIPSVLSFLTYKTLRSLVRGDMARARTRMRAIAGGIG